MTATGVVYEASYIYRLHLDRTTIRRLEQCNHGDNGRSFEYGYTESQSDKDVVEWKLGTYYKGYMRAATASQSRIDYRTLSAL